MSFLERNLSKYIKSITKFMIFDTLIPLLEILPREMIKDSGKSFIRMFNSNIINGAKSEIIKRMRLNKQKYTYKTEHYIDILTL